MLDQAWPNRQPSTKSTPRRVTARLTAEQQQSLLEDYEQGVTGQELADRCGIARSAVIQFLRSHGATIRRKRLSEAEMATIVQLYRSGVRQIDIARQLGRDKGLIWHALRRAGQI